MFFILGGLAILGISFVIALVSMIRERGKVSREAVWQADKKEEVVDAARAPVADSADISKEAGLDSLQTSKTLDEKISPFPWVKGSQHQQILHPKHTTTIGVGLRTNLNNSVSIRDLKKQVG